MKQLITITAFFALSACGQESTDLGLVDEAAALAALSEDEGQALDEVPTGTTNDAATEAADDAEDTSAAPEPMRTCSLDGFRERVMAQYDTDGNGKIEGSELDALRDALGAQPRHRVRWARHQRLARLRWIYDTNGDGALDDAERAQLRADLEVRCENRQQALLAEFDANGDGTLDDGEWLEARAAIMARREQARAAVMAQYDLNGSGTLEFAERQALIADVQARVASMRAQLQAQFDADGSGTLDATEIAALKEYLRTRVCGEQWLTP